ncbi:MAG TPA: hypothetical protein VGF39_02095 [Stellaceae bacterium]|jgi:hypothetical protein
MRGFCTEDQALAWVCWRDEESVDRVAPALGRITFRRLNWRRGFDRHVDIHRREWRNMLEGGNLERLFSPPQPRPEKIGSPADLYAACGHGRLVAWGRYHNGRLKAIPTAEWVGGRPEGWTDIRFDAAELTREFPAPPELPTSANPRDERPPAEAVAPLGKAALDDALDQWARNKWGKDLTKLPDRDELLSRARAEFSKVTQRDIRGLRARLAPDEIKRGGGKMHRRL